MNYKEALDYLYNRLPVFHLKGGEAYKPGLKNTILLLNALGNPQDNFKSIHIAGTNGKGSVSNMLSAILQSAGYKTGLYTSPHLIDFGERIRIDGKMVDHNFVIDFVSRTKQIVEHIQPSFFELTMAMAFDYFSQNKVEIAIIEAGLGGRLDSTNILKPILSVITNIAFDHTEFLGKDLSKIAFEKAGIIKENTPVIIGEYLAETRPVFVAKARDTNSELVFVQDKYLVRLGHSSSEYNEVYINSISVKLGLKGEYQLKNLPSVLEAIDILKKINYKIDDNSISDGLLNVCKLTGLRGRWEILSHNPLIIADTAHNSNGIEELTRQLVNLSYKQLHLITGVVKEKDLNQILKLLPENAIYYFTQAKTPRALDAEILKKEAERFHLKGKSYTEILDAVNMAFKNASKDDLIIIAGSNFVVGEALQSPLFLTESLN